MTRDLAPPQVEGIRFTQQEFDRYQSQAFEDRGAHFFALELAGECGELANLEKKIWRDPSKPLPMDAVSDEAADVLIALLNYCNARGVDLQAAVERKLVRIESKRLAGGMGKTKT